MIIDTIKVLFPAFFSFLIGIAITPFVSHFLYKYEMWKKKSVALALDGTAATISSKLHNDEGRKTPRMGGIIIWVSVILTTLLFALISSLSTDPVFEQMGFLSRNQTWLPLATLIIGATIGFIDDYLVVKGLGKYIGGGIPLKIRIGSVLLLGLVGGYWFFFKLGVSSIHIPFGPDLELGILMIPLFMIVMLALFSGGVIDGIDGLSGGVFSIIFGTYAWIAFFQNQIDLAAFCAVIAGGTLAFLWFNIPPARFYMSETGILALTTTLSVVAFLTQEVVALLIIGAPLFITTASVVIQLLSKKFRNGKKVFLVAPLHHHFEALGWPNYKVTMRYWVITMLFSVVGLMVALVG